MDTHTRNSPSSQIKVFEVMEKLIYSAISALEFVRGFWGVAQGWCGAIPSAAAGTSSLPGNL